ncbi:AbrB family transcriptional regulator [Paralimibaculum aggregatum]|uniref:AbrB family transcriptional regulator n=1 Tax=Paralimibaculum aggregatum TaxID=3036245 RepID=A0ABQ6LDJ8_9RHOB|nr:AbrB family transcriptional regulator [Limibaculum sp. NKW23]GMG81435.1 AbrB family transcriptional regulator [Limibaculum sp. NKW23]
MSASRWAERLRPEVLRRLALGLLVGGLGGALAAWAEVPLAWMLGALFACMIASLAGAPVAVPLWLRANFMFLIGLFLGESFDGIGLAELSRWPATIAGAILYVPVAGWVAYLYYHWLIRQPVMTAVCSAIPGGLTAVVLLAEAFGGDDRAVALSQSLRIAIVIFAAPIVAFGLLGFTPPSEELLSARAPIGWEGIAILVPAALATMWAMDRLGLPIPFLIGPIFASAVLRMTGLVEGALPHWLVEIALVVTGSSIGCRFHGLKLSTWLAVALATLGGTLVLMAVTAVFAWAVAALTGIDYLAALLAYAPGGVAEMSLIALAIDADPGFVALHHVVRIGFILVALPLFAAWLSSRLDRARDEAPGPG